MKTPGQLAFEAYQLALAANTLHTLDRSEAHLQPWESVAAHYQRAWEAAAAACQPAKVGK